MTVIEGITGEGPKRGFAGLTLVEVESVFPASFGPPKGPNDGKLSDGLLSTDVALTSAGFANSGLGAVIERVVFAFSCSSFSFRAFSFASFSACFFWLASLIFIIAFASNSCFSHLEYVRSRTPGRGLPFVLSDSPGELGEEGMIPLPLNTDATRTEEAMRLAFGA